MEKNTENANYQIFVFTYEDKSIEFMYDLKDDTIKIDATKVANLFNRRIDVFLKTNPTQNFLNFINNLSEFPPTGGNSNQKNKIYYESKGHSGTFMYDELALKFAAWIDVSFEHFVYSSFKKILTKKVEPVKEAVTALQNKKDELQKLLLKANNENNEIALKIIELNKDIEKIKRRKSKALQSFANQINMFD
jgi:hypothetical protein